jgi:rRNA-processing protein FCF1
MKFLLDTNFLLIPGRFRVDVFREMEAFGKPELYTIDLVVKELERLAKGRGRDSKSARLGLELIRKKEVEVLKGCAGSADLELERLASEQDFAVCTQDRALQERLRNEGVVVIFLRQGRFLVKL